MTTPSDGFSKKSVNHPGPRQRSPLKDHNVASGSIEREAAHAPASHVQLGTRESKGDAAAPAATWARVLSHDADNVRPFATGAASGPRSPAASSRPSQWPERKPDYETRRGAASEPGSLMKTDSAPGDTFPNALSLDEGDGAAEDMRKRPTNAPWAPSFEIQVEQPVARIPQQEHDIRERDVAPITKTGSALPPIVPLDDQLKENSLISSRKGKERASSQRRKPYDRYDKSRGGAPEPGPPTKMDGASVGASPNQLSIPYGAFLSGSRISVYRQNKGLSVSDWTKPIWCQAQAFYNEEERIRKQQPIETDRMGLRWPKKTPAKATSAQVGGTQTHAYVLGLPTVAITKRRLMREEYFMLNILDFLKGCLTLHRKGYATELPVFGLIRDIRTMGFIDCVRVGEESAHAYVVSKGPRLELVEVKTVDTRDKVPAEPYPKHKMQAMLYHLLCRPLLKDDDMQGHLNTLYTSYDLDPASEFADDLVLQTARDDWKALSQYLPPEHRSPRPKTLFDVSQRAGAVLRSYDLPPLDEKITIAYHRRFGSPQPTSDSAAVPFNPLGGSNFLTAHTILYDEAWLNTYIEPAFKWWTAAPDAKSEAVPVEETFKCK